MFGPQKAFVSLWKQEGHTLENFIHLALPHFSVYSVSGKAYFSASEIGFQG